MREFFTVGACVWFVGGLVTLTQKSSWVHVVVDCTGVLAVALLAIAYRPKEVCACCNK